MKTSELMNALENNNIDEIIDIIPNTSFPDYFEALRKKYKLKKSDIIKNANIDRTYGYQIINGTRNPDKDKVICLALSMKLTLDETNRLLSLSNNGNLYAKMKRDAIIIYCIIRKAGVMKTNEMLHTHNFEILE